MHNLQKGFKKHDQILSTLNPELKAFYSTEEQCLFMWDLFLKAANKNTVFKNIYVIYYVHSLTFFYGDHNEDHDIHSSKAKF